MNTRQKPSKPHSTPKGTATKDRARRPAKRLPAERTRAQPTGPRTLLASERFPIVGIGAFAGGLEALEAFFEHMPSDNGMAFVVVTH